MRAKEILRHWTDSVNQLLEGVHGHQRKALADLSYAMVASGHCDSGHLSLALPTAAKPFSVRRRLERLLDNSRLSAARVAGIFARSLLAPWSQRPLILILDETPKGQRLRCMKISVGYHKRAVPLAWECYPCNHPPGPMPQLLWRLLHRVARTLPRGTQVTLLADRGLSWPIVVDCCTSLGWHYVLRMQGSTHVLLDDGTEKQARELAPRKGKRWLGSNVRVFKNAHWRRCNVVATWEQVCKEPWLLVTDKPASYARCSGYCKRTWCEQMHRDEKSHGFNWQDSQVEDPAHARRLVLLMALATFLAISTGAWVLKRGLRRMLESTRQRKLSIFQLGLRWLQAAVQKDWPLLLPNMLYLPSP